MKKLRLLAVVCACSLTFISNSATAAALVFDANVTPDVIFGSGNANGGFTVDRNNGVELGLRAKLRHDISGQPQNIFNSNGDGTYSFDAGVAPTQSSSTAVWSFEWSINSDYANGSRNLNTLTYLLGIDGDPSAAADFGTFDPINGGVFDHAIGNNSTANGGGTSAISAVDYATLIGTNNVAQNSWKPHWFINPFDPTVDGQYDFFLAAFDDGIQIARTDISVIVGAGAVPLGAAMPLQAAVGLFGSALGLVGWMRRKTNTNR